MILFIAIKREMGCGASKNTKVMDSKPKKSVVGQEQAPAPAVSAAIRTREYYRNSLGGEFIEGFSRTGLALSRKNTMRSQGSIFEQLANEHTEQENNQFTNLKEIATSAGMESSGNNTGATAVEVLK